MAASAGIEELLAQLARTRSGFERLKVATRLAMKIKELPAARRAQIARMLGLRAADYASGRFLGGVPLFDTDSNLVTELVDAAERSPEEALLAVANRLREEPPGEVEAPPPPPAAVVDVPGTSQDEETGSSDVEPDIEPEESHEPSGEGQLDADAEASSEQARETTSLEPTPEVGLEQATPAAETPEPPEAHVSLDDALEALDALGPTPMARVPEHGIGRRGAALGGPTVGGLLERLQRFRQEIVDADELGSQRRLESVLELGPAWARRKAISALIAALALEDLDEALSLIATLKAPALEAWCLGDLLAHWPLDSDERARVVAAAPTAAAARRLARRAEGS